MEPNEFLIHFLVFELLELWFRDEFFVIVETRRNRSLQIQKAKIKLSEPGEHQTKLIVNSWINPSTQLQSNESVIGQDIGIQLSSRLISPDCFFKVSPPHFSKPKVDIETGDLRFEFDRLAERF